MKDPLRFWEHAPTEAIQRVLNAHWEPTTGGIMRHWSNELHEHCCPLGVAFGTTQGLPSGNHPEPSDVLSYAYGIWFDGLDNKPPNKENFALLSACQDFADAFDEGSVTPTLLKVRLREILARRKVQESASKA